MAVRPNGKQVHRNDGGESVIFAARKERQQREREQKEAERREREKDRAGWNARLELLDKKVVRIYLPTFAEIVEEEEYHAICDRIEAFQLAVSKTHLFDEHYDEKTRFYTFAVIRS